MSSLTPFGVPNINEEGVDMARDQRTEGSWPKTFKVVENGTKVLFDINQAAPPQLFFASDSDDASFYVTLDVQDAKVGGIDRHVITAEDTSRVFCEQSCVKERAFTERVELDNDHSDYTSIVKLGHLNMWNSIKLRPDRMEGELTELVLQFIVSKSEDPRGARLAESIGPDGLVAVFTDRFTKASG